MSNLQTVPPSSPELASLEDYLKALRSRSWLPPLCFLLALLAGMAYTGNRVSSYTATSRVLIGATPVGSTNNSLKAPNLDREAEVIVSDDVAVEAAVLVAGDVDPLQLRRDLEVQFQPGSDVIRLSYSDESPDFAASVANAFAKTYVERRVSDQIGYFDELGASLDVRIEQLDTDLADLDATLDDLDAQRASLLAVSTAAEARDALDEIAADRQTAVTLRNQTLSTLRSLNEEKNQLDRDRRIQAPAASLLRTAATPTSPIGISTRMILLGAGLAGLMVGMVLAFLLYRLDKNATEARDVELALGARVIGRIPKIGWRRLTGPGSLVVSSGNKSVSHQRGREAFRRLRASVQFLKSSSGIQSILITSTQPGEGKSVISANLALALAVRGERVVLVSADLRRPTIDTFFGTEEMSGLSDFIGGVVTDLNFFQVEGTPELQVVPSGPVPENPGELLGSSLFEHIANELRDHVDYLIFDTPPVGSAADAVGLASLVDGVILVVDGSRSTTVELARVRSDIEHSGGKLIGSVMNRDQTEGRTILRRSTRYSYERTGAR